MIVTNLYKNKVAFFEEGLDNLGCVKHFNDITIEFCVFFTHVYWLVVGFIKVDVVNTSSVECFVIDVTLNFFLTVFSLEITSVYTTQTNIFGTAFKIVFT